MGLCESCCGASSGSYEDVEGAKESPAVTAEERRKKMLEAAEKRRRAQEGRGLHNPERVKRKQQLREELEKQQESMGAHQAGGEGGLKWQVN